jgi:hypothetical protein
VAIDPTDQAHVVWEDYRNTDGANYSYRPEIWHASTVDGFVNSELVLPDDSANHAAPRVTIDATGLMHVAWEGGGRLFYSNGTDWNTAVQLTNRTDSGGFGNQFPDDPIFLLGGVPVVLYVDLRTGVETIWKSTAWDFAPDTTPPKIRLLRDRTAGISRGIDLSALGSWDNDRIVSYNWSFSGPRDFGLSGYAVHADFPSPGLYNVTLAVQDPSGLSASRTFLLDIRPEPSTVGWKFDRVLYPVSRAYGYLELHPWTDSFPITFLGNGYYSRHLGNGQTVFGPVVLPPAVRESAVFDSEGNLHTVGVGPDYQLQYTKTDRNGSTLVAPKSLSLGGYFPQQPYLAFAADRVWLAWMDQRDGNMETYVAALDLTGNVAWGAVRLSHDPAISQKPILTVVDDHLWIVWWDTRGHGSAAYASVLNLTSLAFDFSEVRMADGLPWDVAPAPGGGVVIAAGVGNMEVAIVRVARNATSTPSVPVSFVDGVFSGPANLDVDSQGNAQVAWWDLGNGSALRFATVSPSGVVDPVGGLRLHVGHGDDLPQVAVRVGPNGEPRIAYTEGTTFNGATLYFADRDRQRPVPVIVGLTNAGPHVPVTFDGTHSTDNETIVAYSWDFGDGATGSGGIVSHAFNATGNYIVTLTVTDDHGNANATNMTITIVPQTLAALFDVSPTLGALNARFVVDASASRDSADLNATVEARWDWDGDGIWDTPWSVNKTAEHTYGSAGIFGLTLEVRTSAGLMNVTSHPVTVDGGAPVTTASPAGTSGTNGWYLGPVTVSLAATDDASGVASTQYRLDAGAWQPYSGPLLLSTDGVHHLEAYSTDVVGNAEPVRTWSISIDSVAPQSSAQRGGTISPTRWYTASVIVTLSATDSTSGVQSSTYRIDGGSWRSATAPFSVQGDGVHQVEFRATDLAGNVEPIRNIELQIDATPPTTIADVAGTEGTGGWFTSDVIVALGATDSVSGIGLIQYRLDGGSVTNYVNPLSLSDGIHFIDYRSVDVAGNQEALKSITVHVDRSAPVLAINPTYDVFTDTHVPISWKATDAPSGVARFEVSLDGNPFESVEMAMEHTFLVTEGDHTVTVWTIDAAGNSAQQSIRFRVDTNVFSISGPYHGAPTIGGIVALVAIGLVLFWKLRPRRPSRLEEMKPVAPETIEEK